MRRLEELLCTSSVSSFTLFLKEAGQFIWAFRLFSYFWLPSLFKNAGAVVALFTSSLERSPQVVRVVGQALPPAETFCWPHFDVILVFRYASFSGPDFNFENLFPPAQA